MLARKTFAPEEVASCRERLRADLDAYRLLAERVGAGAGPGLPAALAAFETRFFNSMVLVLDRFFVHRRRMVSGRDGTPVNEVEMLAASLMHGGGVLQASPVIDYVPERSVTGLRVGERIELSEEDFTRLSEAFLAELEEKFVPDR